MATKVNASHAFAQSVLFRVAEMLGLRVAGYSATCSRSPCALWHGRYMRSYIFDVRTGRGQLFSVTVPVRKVSGFWNTDVVDVHMPEPMGRDQRPGVLFYRYLAALQGTYFVRADQVGECDNPGLFRLGSDLIRRETELSETEVVSAAD